MIAAQTYKAPKASQIVGVYVRSNKYDPTHTSALREAFVRDMKRRFVSIKRLIKQAIVDQDCFGLKNDVRTFASATKPAVLPGNRSYQYMTSQQKVAAFMEWLADQVNAGILETTKIQQIGSSVNTAWTDMYVSDSYKRGVQRARYEMGNTGMAIPPLEATGGIAASMGTPFHMDRVGVLYTRTFSELKGITSSMDSQLSRILSQGIIDGDNPKLLAKKLLRTISGPSGDLGITDSLGRYIPAERRAMMLARTEVIRAHHQGMIQEYRNWAVEGVIVKAEWRTAGFEVCPACAELEGKIFTLNQIENMIPAHPNCRCIAVPTMPEI